MTTRNYWIGVVSKNHVAIGLAGGFTQLNHGKAGPLERMREGDGFAFYSPRLAHPDGPALQAFTAIGRIRDGAIFQADERPDWKPFRRAVDYLPASDAPIKAAARPTVVHPQQAALGRRVSLWHRPRAGAGFRSHRQRHGARFRHRFPARVARTRRSPAARGIVAPPRSSRRRRQWA